MIMKVLMADDEVEVRALVEATLANDRNIEIYTAAEGQPALEIAREVRPDLIFLDVMMPKMNGFEVCQALKSDPATRDIKIVMLTGLAQSPHGHMAVGEDQADDYLLKPFSPVELFRKFEEMAGPSGLHGEAQTQTVETTLDGKANPFIEAVVTQWRYVLVSLAVMALAAAVGVAMYTYAERLQALNARVTVFETVRIEAVVTDPPTVEPASPSPPIY